MITMSKFFIAMLAINAIYAFSSALPLNSNSNGNNNNNNISNNIYINNNSNNNHTNTRYSFSVSRALSKSGQAFVDERAPNGSVVAAVSLIDTEQASNANANSSSSSLSGPLINSSSDPSSITTVAIEKGNEHNHFTLVNARYSHMIRVNGQLDKHKIPQYNFTIVARQNYTNNVLATANLVIRVNNCVPKFTMPNVQMGSQSPSGAPVGYFHLPLTDTLQANAKILTVTATDCDEDDILFYKVTSCDDELLSPESQDLGLECPIKIDDSTGELRTATMIDKDRTLKISIFIEVRDGAGNKDTMHVVLSKSLPVNGGPDVPPSPFNSTTQDPTVYGVAIVMAFLMSIMVVIFICLVRIRCMMGKTHDPHHHRHHHPHGHGHHHHHNHHPQHAHHHRHLDHHVHHSAHHSTHRINSTSHINSSLHHVNSSMQSLGHDWPMNNVNSMHNVNSIHHARSVSSPNPHPYQHQYQQQQQHPQQQQAQPNFYEQQPNSQIK